VTLDTTDRAAIRAALAQRDAADMKFGQGGYRDKGCDMAPSCLSCPFVSCRHDISAEKVRENKVQQRNYEIRRLRTRDGVTVKVLAEQFGLVPTTVTRIVNRGASA
tara:strand:- start:462 stop:779 length:318 start_codon:yes stop_codon:yes gene_type:complete